jgi:carboxymethylenebutenolidase
VVDKSARGDTLGAVSPAGTIMGERIKLNTAGMHCIGAYLAKPAGKPKGGVVVVQEIFGVNAHIRSVADGYAAHGYTAIAPAFFDFAENDVELAYDEAGIDKGRNLAMEVGLDRAVEAVASAAEAIGSSGKVGVVGYCWGGTVALRAAQVLGLPASSYYGGRNVGFLDQPLKAPAIFHFGADDPSIPPEAIAKQRAAWPDAPVYVYEHCGHAFNRDADPHAYNAVAAKLALERTLALFAKHLA